jgi:hypothetical protein
MAAIVHAPEAGLVTAVPCLRHAQKQTAIIMALPLITTGQTDACAPAQEVLLAGAVLCLHLAHRQTAPIMAPPLTVTGQMDASAPAQQVSPAMIAQCLHLATLKRIATDMVLLAIWTKPMAAIANAQTHLLGFRVACLHHVLLLIAPATASAMTMTEPMVATASVQAVTLTTIVPCPHHVWPDQLRSRQTITAAMHMANIVMQKMTIVASVIAMVMAPPLIWTGLMDVTATALMTILAATAPSLQWPVQIWGWGPGSTISSDRAGAVRQTASAWADISDFKKPQTSASVHVTSTLAALVTAPRMMARNTVMCMETTATFLQVSTALQEKRTPEVKPLILHLLTRTQMSNASRCSRVRLIS